MEMPSIQVRSVTGARRKNVSAPDALLLTPNVAPVEFEPEHILGIRQRQAWDSYVNPKSKTFGNAKQSAIAAGYSEGYANQITTKAWWLGKMRRLRLLSKAEAVLEEMLEMPVLVTTWEGRGEDAEQVVVTETGLVRVKQDTAKFLAERLGKDEGYSSRSEITGKDGVPIGPTPEQQAIANAAIDKFLNQNGPK